MAKKSKAKIKKIIDHSSDDTSDTDIITGDGTEDRQPQNSAAPSQTSAEHVPKAESADQERPKAASAKAELIAAIAPPSPEEESSKSSKKRNTKKSKSGNTKKSNTKKDKHINKSKNKKIKNKKSSGK
ncbi:MAG: hypothetical protein AB7E29_02115 [Xanthobacter sp.]